MTTAINTVQSVWLNQLKGITLPQVMVSVGMTQQPWPAPESAKIDTFLADMIRNGAVIEVFESRVNPENESVCRVLLPNEAVARFTIPVSLFEIGEFPC